MFKMEPIKRIEVSKCCSVFFSFFVWVLHNMLMDFVPVHLIFVTDNAWMALCDKRELLFYFEVENFVTHTECFHSRVISPFRTYIFCEALSLCLAFMWIFCMLNFLLVTCGRKKGCLLNIFVFFITVPDF